jgi:uncharacterized protein
MYGFFRTHQGEEVDLVVQIGTKKIGFERKASSSPSISAQNYAVIELLGLHKLFVVVPDGDPNPIVKDKVIVTPLPGIAKVVAAHI